MGGAQTRLSTTSPSRGLPKKTENGNAKLGKHVEARRSTGQRFPGKDSDQILRPDVRNSNAGGRSSGTKEAKKVSGVGGSGSSGGTGSSAGNVPKRVTSVRLRAEEELVDGWPKWLTDNIPRNVLAGLVPRSADSYEMLDKVGQGTYSNVYKARDKGTGKIVALKKVRFDTSEPESVKFMAREIMILQKLDHPNIVKLEGLATSRMHYSLYLVFDYMYSDLARIISRPGERLTEPQIKCYMHQLLLGLQHCHDRGILHRDIKGSNLLIDKNGMLKIADFGLANYFNPALKNRLTSRVVTLWYRAPELLLGATDYGVGIDLWSAGCLLAEMFVGRPIIPGRTEVEQLHRIFKLCGTPSEECWRRLKVSTAFRPPGEDKPSFRQVFRDFPTSSFGLLKILLALNPASRGSAGSALQNEFFYTDPLACDLSGLPLIYKEHDEPSQTNERRRHRNSKMRQRSRTQRENRRKDLGGEKPIGDLGSSKEEPERRAELNVEQGSSTATNTSSSIQRSDNEGSSPLPLLSSPNVTYLRNMSLNSEAYFNATKNRPPLPKPKTSSIKYNHYDDNMNVLNQVLRSSSTREFRKLDQRKFLELHVIDD